jgi:hypothetical protein
MEAGVPSEGSKRLDDGDSGWLLKFVRVSASDSV